MKNPYGKSPKNTLRIPKNEVEPVKLRLTIYSYFILSEI